VRSSTLLTPADAYRAALRGADCRVIAADAPGGVVADLDAWRWAADPNKSDHELLARCSGSTVDIGCGPGRMTAALMARGVAALGVDVVAEAVRQTNARGGMALERDVFSRLPGEGRWDTALLADGNIGIGGDPLCLLRRVAEIVTPRGRVVVDLAPPGGDVATHRIALEVGGRRTRAFRWAVVPADRIEKLANEAAMRALDVVEVDGRWFAELERIGRDA
jgi:SAM-dependent methyltransferase